MNEFDADYYECGIETGKSCYQSYRWMPEATMAMAMSIIDALDIKPRHTILDYGCAKGYLVKALRILHRKAWGVDISEYAISQVDKETNGYCTTLEKFNNGCDFPTHFDFCIAKDVFEHIPKEELCELLQNINVDKMFVVVPLGDNGKYFAPANDLDVTHIICEDQWWWRRLFQENGWRVTSMNPVMKGVKDSYTEAYPSAHGFYFLDRDRFYEAGVT